MARKIDECVAHDVLALSHMSAFFNRASPCPQLEAGLVDREGRVLLLQMSEHRRQLCTRPLPHYRGLWLLSRSIPANIHCTGLLLCSCSWRLYLSSSPRAVVPATRALLLLSSGPSSRNGCRRLSWQAANELLKAGDRLELALQG